MQETLLNGAEMTIWYMGAIQVCANIELKPNTYYFKVAGWTNNYYCEQVWLHPCVWFEYWGMTW